MACRRLRQSDLTPSDLYTTYLSFLIEAHRLKTLYASQINLLVGIESEYITDSDLSALERLLQEQDGRIQYVVGSVHHVDSIPVDFDVSTFETALAHCKATRSSPQEYLKMYFDDQYKMLRTIRPMVVGHFDLCRLFAPEIQLDADTGVWEKVVRNIDHVVGYGGLFEVNAASFRKGWDQAYPGKEVLQVSLDHAFPQIRPTETINVAPPSGLDSKSSRNPADYASQTTLTGPKLSV
jgi:histidinol-phosphatase (PHP family)